MSLVDTFGDAISSLRTDDPTSQANTNEIEMAETLFNKLADKYNSGKEEDEDKPISTTSSKSSIKTILKRSVFVALIVLILLTPFIRSKIQAFSDHSFVYYIFMFVSVIVAGTIVQKTVN